MTMTKPITGAVALAAMASARPVSAQITFHEREYHRRSAVRPGNVVHVNERGEPRA